MNYLYCTFWIFGRYMHHGSAAAGGLCLLFNGSHKMRCIQSPCKDGEWENSFCRVMAELLNYLFNWDGGKKISSRVWKSIYGSVWKCSGQKNSWGFFFWLGSWKEKKSYFTVYKLFHRVLLSMQLFFNLCNFNPYFMWAYICSKLAVCYVVYIVFDVWD